MKKYSKKAVEKFKKDKEFEPLHEYAQESFLCQMPLNYFSPPPEGQGASVDCEIKRNRKVLDRKTDKEISALMIYKWKLYVPEEYRGKGMGTVDAVVGALESIAMEQGFESPNINISYSELSKRAGFTSVGGIKKVRECLDYLRRADIETNVYFEFEKEGDIHTPRRTIKYRFLNKIIEDEYLVKGKDGKTKVCKKMTKVQVSDVFFNNWKDGKKMRFFPLSSKAITSMAPREMKLYKVIFAQMGSHKKYDFRISDLRQELTITFPEESKVRIEIGRLMRSLVKRDIGIEKFRFIKRSTGLNLEVKGDLQSEDIKVSELKDRKTWRDYEDEKRGYEISTVKALSPGRRTIPRRKKADTDEAKDTQAEKAIEILRRYNFTASDLKKYAKNWSVRVIAIGKYLDNSNSMKNPGGFIRKTIDERLIGDWDEGIIYELDTNRETAQKLASHENPVELLSKLKKTEKEVFRGRKIFIEYVYGKDALEGIDEKLKKYKAERDRQEEEDLKKLEAEIKVEKQKLIRKLKKDPKLLAQRTEDFIGDWIGHVKCTERLEYARNNESQRTIDQRERNLNESKSSIKDTIEILEKVGVDIKALKAEAEMFYKQSKL